MSDEWEDRLQCLIELGGTDTSKKLAEDLFGRLLLRKFLDVTVAVDDSKSAVCGPETTGKTVPRYVVIFLDVDGVLKSFHGKHLPYETQLGCLKRIVEHFDAESRKADAEFDAIGIVLSTTWRKDMDDLRDLVLTLECAGLSQYLIGCTPPWKFHVLKHPTAIYREVEIDSWLKIINGTFAFDLYYDMSRVTDSDFEDSDDSDTDSATHHSLVCASTGDCIKKPSIAEAKEDETECDGVAIEPMAETAKSDGIDAVADGSSAVGSGVETSIGTVVMGGSEEELKSGSDELASVKAKPKFVIDEPVLVEAIVRRFDQLMAAKKVWNVPYKDEMWRAYSGRIQVVNHLILDDFKMEALPAVASRHLRTDECSGLTEANVNEAIAILKGDALAKPSA